MVFATVLIGFLRVHGLGSPYVYSRAWANRERDFLSRDNGDCRTNRGQDI